MADKRISELISTNIVDPADNFVLQRGATNLRILGSDLIAALEGTTIAGKDSSALAQAPTATEDGYAITWDNTAGEYNLTAAADPTKIATQATNALVQAPTATEDGYVIAWNNTNNEYELVAGGGGGGIYGGDGALPAGETNVTMGANTLSFDFADATTAGKIVLKDGGNEWARIRQLDTTFEHHVQFSSTGVETENRGALLQLRSTTQAVLFPRMNTTERDAIPTPVGGMLMYNNLTNEFNFHNGTSWGAFGGGADGNGIFDSANNGSVWATTSYQVNANITETLGGGGTHIFMRGGNGSTFEFDTSVANVHHNFVWKEQGAIQGAFQYDLFGNGTHKDGFKFYARSFGTNTESIFFDGLNDNVVIPNGNLLVGAFGAPVAPTERLKVVGGAGQSPLRVDTNTINNALLVNSSGDVSVNRSTATVTNFDIVNANTGALSRFKLNTNFQIADHGSAQAFHVAYWNSKIGLSGLSSKTLAIGANAADLLFVNHATSLYTNTPNVSATVSASTGNWGFGVAPDGGGWSVKTDLARISDILGIEERVGDPASGTNLGQLYCKDVAGVTELFFRRSNNTSIQLS